MGFKTGSFISVGNRGLNPTNSLERTRRVNNPVWNFTLPYTFQGTVSGYASGGRFPSPNLNTNTIDKFPFATNANATDVGDLTSARFASSGQSSDVSGYTSGGEPGYPGYSNIIDKFPFSANANATDVGDLTVARSESAGQSSDVSGYTSGGGPRPSPSNVIDKFPFASDANATDVGDLTLGRYGSVGQQN
jgi:hypothetical protein